MPNKICKNCRYFNSQLKYRLDGQCALSTNNGEVMFATDLHAEEPSLEVSENFGCNQFMERGKDA